MPEFHGRLSSPGSLAGAGQKGNFVKELMKKINSSKHSNLYYNTTKLHRHFVNSYQCCGAAFQQ